MTHLAAACCCGGCPDFGLCAIPGWPTSFLLMVNLTARWRKKIIPGPFGGTTPNCGLPQGFEPDVWHSFPTVFSYSMQCYPTGALTGPLPCGSGYLLANQFNGVAFQPPVFNVADDGLSDGTDFTLGYERLVNFGGSTQCRIETSIGCGACSSIGKVHNSAPSGTALRAQFAFTLLVPIEGSSLPGGGCRPLANFFFSATLNPNPSSVMPAPLGVFPIDCVYVEALGSVDQFPNGGWFAYEFEFTNGTITI